MIFLFLDNHSAMLVDCLLSDLQAERKEVQVYNRGEKVC